MKEGSYSYQSSLSWKVRIKDTPLTIAFSKTSSIISILVCSVIKILLLTESFEMHSPPTIKTSENTVIPARLLDFEGGEL
jgi:hypothetical protein